MPTNREMFLDIFDLPRTTSLSLKEIAQLSQIPLKALKEVYNRGIGAWKGNISSVRLKNDFSKNPNTAKYPRSARLSKEQWAFGRVYSFVLGNDTTFYGADKDISVKYKLF
jgi:hypothetical protein